MSGSSGSSTGRARDYLRQAFLTGLAITIPSIVTIVVLVFAYNFISNIIDPLTLAFQDTFDLGNDLPAIVVQIIAAAVLGFLILFVGLTAESRYGGGGLATRVEDLLASIPGVGSIYRSIDEISELLLESDTDSFKEVKLVEYPDEGSYTLAFLTADTPEVVREATGHGEMVTLFMPMAPNPVMGGYVVHVSEDRVYDVNMTVEEGIQSIVSSGVAVNDPDGTDTEPLSEAGETAGGELI
jgi:uncharacterized membrane protein